MAGLVIPCRNVLLSRSELPYVYPSRIAYGIPVILAPLLSRDLYFKAFGVSLFIAYLVAYYGWFRTHPSVWCYFSAILSVPILLNFRMRSEAAGGIGHDREMAKSSA